MDVSELPPADLYISEELNERLAKVADFLQEKQAIQELATRMVDEPDAVLPRFVELAMQMTGGISAGLSLLEPHPSPGVFRWQYLQGILSRFENAETPRNFSPCGTTLDRNGPVLSRHPERYFNWISDAGIVVPELLLIPLQIGGKEPKGTLWIVAGEVGHFNAQHARIAGELASFVGIALKMLRTEQNLKDAVEEQSTLIREMDHRIKNLFSISIALLKHTDKATHSKEELTQTLTGRFHALASAHGLVRRQTDQTDLTPKISTIVELLNIIVRPHENAGSTFNRFLIDGPAIYCGERALSAMALIFHELATNALKYGALASDEGRVSIEWAQHQDIVVFKWCESGGPTIEAAPQTSGFGSKLLRDTVELQLQGKLQQLWSSSGLVVQFSIPAKNITA